MRLISSVHRPRMIGAWRCEALRRSPSQGGTRVPMRDHSVGSFFALLALFIGADHVVRTGINWSSVFITLPDELLVYGDKGDVGWIEPNGVPAIIQEVQSEVDILGERAVQHPADVIEVARELAIFSRLVLCDVESVGFNCRQTTSASVLGQPPARPSMAASWDCASRSARTRGEHN